MTLKPPTRTFPKLVMKDWPHVARWGTTTYVNGQAFPDDKALSDFTRVLEGVQKVAPLRKQESDHD